MISSLRLIAIAAVTLMAAPALAECVLPDGPVLPEGRTAVKEQMIAAVGEVKAYQAALVEYRGCIDEETAALGDDSGNGENGALTSLYDDSVDLEEALATRWNSQIRDYNAQKK